MRSCVVLGTGRSGTSLLTSILADAGLDPGPDLLSPQPSNPRGFYESKLVNAINERILAPYDSWFRDARGHVQSFRDGQRWLATLDPGIDVDRAPRGVGQLIRERCQVPGFVLKDPRFSLTLDVWRPELPPDTLQIVAFRRPEETVASVLREIATRDYLAGLEMDEATVFDWWTATYVRILRWDDQIPGCMVWVPYESVVDGRALPMLSETLGMPLSPHLADPGLHRNRSAGSAPHSAAALYGELCRRAGSVDARLVPPLA